MFRTIRNRKSDNEKNIDYKKLISWLWLLGGIFWDIGYQIVRGQAMLDSDMSSEILLADLLNKEHSFIGLTKNWLYSTELDFFSVAWLFRIGLAISPHNWHIARTISMAIGIILLAFAAWLVFYAVGLPELGIWAAAFTVFPGGGWYFWQNIYGGFYLEYTYLILFSFALSVMALRNSGLLRNKLYVVAVILIGICAGIKGVRCLMLFYFPLTLSAALVMYYELRSMKKNAGAIGLKEFLQGKPFSFMVISLIALVSSIVGYCINTNVLSVIYSYDNHSENTITESSFIYQIRNFIWNYGFAKDKVFMSFRGVASIGGVIFGILILLSGIMLIIRFDKLDLEQRWLIALATVSIAFCIFIFSYVEEGNINYYQPILPLGYFLLLLEIHTEKWVLKEGRFVLCNILMASFLVISIGTVLNENDGPVHNYRAKDAELNDIVTWLRGSYNKGVSPYWTSNLITELSDGDIEMWTLDEYDCHKWYEYLQKTDHLNGYPDEKYFFLVEKKSGDEAEYMERYVQEFLDVHPELSEIYSDEIFAVYGTP